MPVYTEMVKDKKTGKMIEKKVGDGKQKQYYIRTYVTDEFGKRKQITKHNKNWIGRDGYWEAVEEENNLKKKGLISQNNSKQEQITFKQLFELKCNYDNLYNNNSLSTRVTYKENLRIHVFPAIGDKLISNLTKNDILEIIHHLREHKIIRGKRKGSNLSIKFTNEIIHTIKSTLKFGCEFYNLNDDLLKYLIDIQEDHDKVVKVDPFKVMKKKTVLSSKDWEKISKAMEEIIKETPIEKKGFIKKMMIFFTTEYILMTRVGETQAMTYSNLLTDYKIYNLYEAYNKKLKKVTPTKNRDARILYIPDSLIKTFLKLYEMDSQEIDFSESQFIFGKEKVFARTTIDRYRKKVLDKAQIEYLTNHELRHAGISNAMYNQVDPSAIADMSGHDKEIMYKIYVQTLEDANYDLVNTLDKLTIPSI